MKKPPIRNALSYFRAILLIIVIAAVAVQFVKREIEIDVTSRNIRELENEISSLLMKTAEVNIELEELTAFPKIVKAAQRYGLSVPVRKPEIIDAAISEFPPEIFKHFAPLPVKTDTIMTKE